MHKDSEVAAKNFAVLIIGDAKGIFLPRLCGQVRGDVAKVQPKTVDVLLRQRSFERRRTKYVSDRGSAQLKNFNYEISY